MFGIPGKQAVTMTPAAVTQVRKLMERDGRAGLRIGVKKGGCAGMEYTMEFVDEADKNDEIVDQDGARVMIAPMAQMFLFGTEIDATLLTEVDRVTRVGSHAREVASAVSHGVPRVVRFAQRAEDGISERGEERLQSRLPP